MSSSFKDVKDDFFCENNVLSNEYETKNMYACHR